MNRKSISVFALIALIGLSISPWRFVRAQSAHAKWTVMIYLAADNNLEPNSIINLMEMAMVGSTPDVNVVAQITRPPDYKGFYGEWGGTRRFLVTKSDESLSSGDFQISETRLADYLTATATDSGLTQEQVTNITRGPVAEQEKAALQLTIPTIEKDTTLAPLDLVSVQDLGSNVNSGDATTLADFGTWAVQTYPADHYGLILWDHGGGWSMIASDDTLGDAGIHMPELQTALESITQTANQKLDFIGFDACLMAQLPVSIAVKSYADYQFAAEELVPGFGWDYTPFIAALEENPNLPVPELGKVEVDAFDVLYDTTQKEAGGSYDMGVIDLSKIDGVVTALDEFTNAVKAAPGNELKAISTARNNAQEFSSIGFSSEEADAISSIDLSDFMRLMVNLSSDSGVKQAANNVIEAVSQSVSYHKPSKLLPQAKGLSIFFPANDTIFKSSADGERYRQEFSTLLPSWQDFLDTFYGTASTEAAASALTLKISDVSTKDTPGSIYDPPVISYTLSGKNIVEVSAGIVYQLDENTNIVLDSFPIDSGVTAEDGTQIDNYADGESTNDFYWNARFSTISDGKNQTLVQITTNADDEQHGFIAGLFTDRVTGKTAQASLIIDFETDQSSGLWVSSSSNAIAQVAPRPGDTFQPTFTALDADGSNPHTITSNTILAFGREPMQVTDAPAPDGTYRVVLTATDAAGTQSADVVMFDVKNAGLDPSWQGFKDLSFGLSFLYPSDWTDASTFQRADDTTELYMSDISGEITFSAVNPKEVTSLEEVSAKLQEEIEAIEGVTLGDTAEVTVGQEPGTSLTYTYTNEDGVEITGTAIAVYATETQQGYILKFEAPTDQAEEAQKVLEEALNTSTFF